MIKISAGTCAQGRAERLGRLRTCLAAALVGTVLTTGIGAGAASANPRPTPTPAVPSPTVSGPTTGGTHGYPYWSTTLDLATHRYVEEEYFFRGTARSLVPVQPLDGITDGRWDSTPTGATADYDVRMLVRRPQHPAKFNGKVIVEWMNVTEGWEIDPIWTLASDELIRSGYAYVGVGAQRTGTSFLQTWDSSRYGGLNHPGDSFSYDIFSQAGMAIAHPRRGAIAPLGNLTPKVRALLAGGQSQSGGRMITYINAAHPTANVYDGFLVVSSSRGAGLSQAPQPAIGTPGGAQSRIRTDIAEPVLVYLPETDVPGAATGLHQQPDSDRFRLWEYTGTAHADRFWFEASAPTRVKAGVSGPALESRPYGLLITTCSPTTPINEGPSTYATRAAVDAIGEWSIKRNRAPAIGDRISLTIPTTGAASVDRDPATGIAIGGIRLPQITVPTETLRGQGSSAGGFCTLFGLSDRWNRDTDPFDGQVIDNPAPSPEPDVRSLYGSPHRYVARVHVAANHAASDRLLLRADIAAVVNTARQVRF